MRPDLAKRLGFRVRSLREAQHLSAQVLADRAGVSMRTVRYLEDGSERAPRLDTVERLADALGVPIGDLLGASPTDVPPGVESLVHAVRQLPGDSVELLTAVAARMRGESSDSGQTDVIASSVLPGGLAHEDIDAAWDLLEPDEKAAILSEWRAHQILNERVPRGSGGNRQDDDQRSVRARGDTRRVSG